MFFTSAILFGALVGTIIAMIRLAWPKTQIGTDAESLRKASQNFEPCSIRTQVSEDALCQKAILNFKSDNAKLRRDLNFYRCAFFVTLFLLILTTILSK